ncbi:MAG TPA: molybdopterin-dependent oxidoreductase [Anaeromyxobacter sp.]|nr:molybdopterin-dependent oxidoreductase [Anaeromyxobacter sp.]
MKRREFLKFATVAAGAVAAKDALAFDYLAPVGDPLGHYPYRGWEDLYRALWSFDWFGRTSHSVNCTGSCTWRGFVKNGILFKEEQFADYPEIESNLPPEQRKLPVYNPRGCQKGANHKEYVYGPQRVKYPLVRVGARGQGFFRKATWDEALGLVASKVVSAIDTPWSGGSHSPDAVTFFAAIPAKHHITLSGGFRLANLIGGVVCSFYDWYCDLPPGEPMTWGVQTDSCESADWFNSKYILIMGANLMETRIPDSHYFVEARYRGAKIVMVAPEYSPTSIHADLFVPIKPGTDGALCLGMANVIVGEGRFDRAYVKQFTDLPMLVRTDNGKILREADFVGPTPGLAPDADPRMRKVYLWNTAGEVPGPVIAPGSLGIPHNDPRWTLDLARFGIDPALEGSFTVTLQGGKEVTVTTVFELMKEKLAAYSPAAVSGITGIDASLVADMAREFAAAKPARIIEGAGTNHYFHNDLINRAQILLVALTGNVGTPGGGFDHYVGQEKLWAEHGFFELSFPLGRPKQRFQNTTLWTYAHADVKSDIDSILPRPLMSYIRESVANGWMPLWPKGTLDNGRDPKVLFVWGANYLNQAKGYQDVEGKLWPKLDLIVDLNFRMDSTAMYADVVLPAGSHFEKFDLSTTDLHTYVHPFTPIINLLHQSKSDWQIWRELAGALQQTGFKFTDPVPDGSTVTRDFSTLQSQFDTHHSRILGTTWDVSDDRNTCQFLLSASPETDRFNIAGPHRFANVGEMSSVPGDSIIKHPQRFPRTSEEWTSDIKEGVAYYGFQRMTEHKRPLLTLAGRQQFYLDHDWILYDFKEQLPVHKGPVDIDQYPLRWITPHGRWSIHSTWRDAKFQLRLQRGRPIVYLSPNEARARGLLDNDYVTIFNNHGRVDAHLCITPRLPDGLAMMYHGWERYTLNDGWQSPTNIRIKPTQLVGKYAQLNFRLNYWGPTGNQKDTRVDIRFKRRESSVSSAAASSAV